MGITNSSQSSTGSTNSVGGGVFKLKAGGAINLDDIVQLGPDGKCYPVRTVDYAAVANCVYGTSQTSASVGQIIAQTQVVAGQTMSIHRQAVLQGVDGSIYTFTCNTSGQGALLSRYSAIGSLISQVVVDSAATQYSHHQMFTLSNGAICVAYTYAGSGAIYFAIYEANLYQVKGSTALPEGGLMNSGNFSAVPLSAGGFAVVYQFQTTSLQSRFTTYDNAGVVVTAPITIWTRTGTSAAQHHKMMQLSNGNLVIAASSINTVSSIGLFHGVITVTGASVLAFANIDSQSVPAAPELSILNGFYSISRANSINMRAWVFDNAGILQGAEFTNATGAGAAANQTKLLNDGACFWLIWPRTSDSKEVLTKIPTNGAGYVTTIVTPSNGISGAYIDAFYEGGLIVGVTQYAGVGAPRMWVISTETGQLFNNLETIFGVAATTSGGQYQRIIPGGDFSFICLYDYGSAAATNLCVGKYANTAVMGVAQSAAAKDALVSCSGIAGGYVSNYVKGSPSKVFDHSATNLYGNKGALMNYGAVLKGF